MFRKNRVRKRGGKSPEDFGSPADEKKRLETGNPLSEHGPDPVFELGFDLPDRFLAFPVNRNVFSPKADVPGCQGPFQGIRRNVVHLVVDGKNAAFQPFMDIENPEFARCGLS